MVENFLLSIGMRCGTVKNFNNVIMEDLRVKDDQHWYFLTPIKSTDKATGLKECTVNLAYPFIAETTDINEQVVIERLSPILSDYERDLLKILRKVVIVPYFTFTGWTFWANEKGERNERKDFGQLSIHIINASMTIKYRETWFKN